MVKIQLILLLAIRKDDWNSKREEGAKQSSFQLLKLFKLNEKKDLNELL